MTVHALREVARLGRLPVVNFAAGGIGPSLSIESLSFEFIASPLSLIQFDINFIDSIRLRIPRL